MMPAMSTKFNKLELCTIVLHAIVLRISTAFYAAVHNEFPTEITRLTTRLKSVCDQNKEHHRMIKKFSQQDGPKEEWNRILMKLDEHCG